MPKTRPFKIIDWEKKFQCSKCNEFLPADEFVKKTKSKYWIASLCKKCKRGFWHDNNERINEKRKVKYHMKSKWLDGKEALNYLNDWENRIRKPRITVEKDWVMLYKCNSCYKFLPREHFWKWKNGEPSYSCIDCAKDKHKVYNMNNREKRIKYSEERHKRNKEHEKEYYEKCKEDGKRNKYAKQYSNKKSKEIWYSRDYFHLKTRQFKIKNWIEFEGCAICWKKWKIQMHHPSYETRDMREFIVPVCPKCHVNIHNWFIDCPAPIKLTDLAQQKQNGNKNENLWKNPWWIQG